MRVAIRQGPLEGRVLLLAPFINLLLTNLCTLRVLGSADGAGGLHALLEGIVAAACLCEPCATFVAFYGLALEFAGGITLRRPLLNLNHLVGGGLLVLSGLVVAAYALFYWYRLSFGPVEGDTLIRMVCAASVLISIGFQLIFSAFFMLLLDQQQGQILSSDATAEAAAPARVSPMARNSTF